MQRFVSTSVQSHIIQCIYYVATALCLSVSLFLTRRHFIMKAEHNSAYPTLCWNGITMVSVLSSGTLSQTLGSETSRHGISYVASVVNLVRPTIVASLSHWLMSFHRCVQHDGRDTDGVSECVARVSRQSLLYLHPIQQPASMLYSVRAMPPNNIRITRQSYIDSRLRPRCATND